MALVEFLIYAILVASNFACRSSSAILTFNNLILASETTTLRNASSSDNLSFFICASLTAFSTANLICFPVLFF
jgi:hypothetical protein